MLDRNKLTQMSALALCLAALAHGAHAQSAPAGPIAAGSGDTQVGGKPAARAGDAASGATLVGGSPDVFINGKPAAVSGVATACGAHVATGSSHVFVNGKPLAAAGDPTTPCAK